MPPGAFSRRDFLKTSALAGGTLAFGAGCASTRAVSAEHEYLLNDPEHFIYSVCLQCHTSCPIKVKLQDGFAVKIDGNPFGIQTMMYPLAYETDVRSAGQIDGKLCPKGQAGLQSQYDPYRLTKVLKRAGKRGEDRWMTIPFEDAVREIVEGGTLFSHVPGEEDRHVPGLRDLYRLRDAALAREMAADAKAVGKGTMSVAAFKAKHAAHLDRLIDPDHPDFGPVNNQFVFMAGRIEHGRKEFAKRWLNGGFGSVNWYEHTTICEQSHHIAYARMTDQYAGGKWGGGKSHMKPDLYDSRFVIFFGTGAFEANFGPPMLSELVTDALVNARMKIAVVDPRLSKTAAKAWKWAPVLPGTDAAFAYGMMRWMLDHEAYDASFLRHANQAAANAAGELTWTNATHLVRIEDDGPGKLLRAADLGLGDAHTFVAMRNGRPVPVTDRPVAGDLFFDGTLRGIRVKTAFQVLADYVRQFSVEEWAGKCGVDADLVAVVAKEFARHGKQSVAELYRGAVQHTNGYYNAQAIITLNLLVGNVDWKGGLSVGGGHWHEDGSKSGQPFNVVKGMHPGKMTTFGHLLTREKSRYEDSTLYRENGYPAKRPWFPHTNNVYQEIIPSAQDAYPYPIKALFLHKGTPALASPAGHKVIEALVDTDAVPLFFSCDIVIGETSMFADYIFPDTAIWERWGAPHTTPAAPIAQSKVRQPTVEPLVETVTVFGEEVPLNMEAVMLAIAERLGLPGYGRDGFGPGMDFTRQEDFFLKMFANLAAGDKPGDAVPDADVSEMEVFLKARAHLSPRVFDPERFRRAVVDAGGKDWWPKVVYLLNRGGRYENITRYHAPGDQLPHPFKRQFNVYVESVASTRHSYSGKRFSGIGVWEPVKAYDGRPIEDPEMPLRLITYKHIVGGQSRTIGDYWLERVFPENPVLINTRTAARLGLKENDVVKLVSASNPKGVWDLRNGEEIEMRGRVHLTQGIHPEVVAVSWHFGHWAYGANDAVIDGRRIPGDEVRRKGLCPNAAMRVDPALANVTLEDVIGGSASYFDTRIDLVPV